MRLVFTGFLLICVLSACGGGGASAPALSGVGAQVAASTSTPASATPQPSVPQISATLPPSGGLPTVGGCTLFPADNAWNQDISNAPLDPNSANYLANMNAATTKLHPDFGSNPTYGIPYSVVPGSQAFVPMAFDYASESDPGPYPIPSTAPVEGGPGATGDRHVLVVDSGNCMLYEVYAAQYAGPGWHGGSGAVFNLANNALRPDYWTSADAAGLPILPGLVRYDETAAGAIRHALRFTVRTTQRAFIHPATHYASSTTSANAPPMGLRVRLKANVDLSIYRGASLVVLTALKRYGMFVADNGSDWYISGATDGRWDDNDLNQMKTLPASAFEVVQSGPVIK